MPSPFILSIYILPTYQLDFWHKNISFLWYTNGMFSTRYVEKREPKLLVFCYIHVKNYILYYWNVDLNCSFVHFFTFYTHQKFNIGPILASKYERNCHRRKYNLYIWLPTGEQQARSMAITGKNREGKWEPNELFSGCNIV